MARTPKDSGLGARAFGAGLTMAVTVALFSYGGYLLDGLLGTEPLFLVIGALLGILGGTIHLLAALAPESLPFGRRKPPERPSPSSRQAEEPDSDKQTPPDR